MIPAESYIALVLNTQKPTFKYAVMGKKTVQICSTDLSGQNLLHGIREMISEEAQDVWAGRATDAERNCIASLQFCENLAARLPPAK